MNPNLNTLQAYPFEKLRHLKSGLLPPENKSHISMSIGEPRHPAPEFVLAEISKSLANITHYPTTKGIPKLRQTIANWLVHRFQLVASSLDPESQILPVNGTREALFSIAQCVIDRNKPAYVLMPNPFYQIYEGATLLTGASPYFLNTTKENGYIPNYEQIPESVWEKCQLLYICTPGNPAGAVMSIAQLQQIIHLADKFDFIIASDECYSEIYFEHDNPPVGLLQASADMKRNNYERCIVFHSLSKRSNLAGLRSGFVVGDEKIIEQFFQYRTYHGCAMPTHHQTASIMAWSDEIHVQENRRLYTEKFNAVLKILKPCMMVERPDAAFYLWPETPINDQDFAKNLYASQNISVLPGSYLSRTSEIGNPGENHIRLALVSSFDECIDAANRIKSFIETL